MDGLSIVGLLIIGFAIAQCKWQRMALRNGFKVTGKVIGFQPNISLYSGGTQHTSEFPIVEYLGQDGIKKSDQMNASNPLGKFKLGDEIAIVKYENKLHHRNLRYWPSIVIGLVGVAMIIIDHI